MSLYDGSAFRMIGNVYYVGTERVSSHLVTSSEGHVLIDTCYPGDGPAIARAIESLGFELRDVKHVLLTHAHFDHVGGANMLRERTGAEVRIGEADVEAVRLGDAAGFGMQGVHPIEIDRPLRDGEIVSVGGNEITVYHTPGHTPGCCSFGFTVEDDGKKYRAFLFGGPGRNVFQKEFVEKGGYGGSIQDFGKTLDGLETMQVDVALGAHPGQNWTFEKLAHLREGAKPNPFIDPDGWKAFLGGVREDFARLR